MAQAKQNDYYTKAEKRELAGFHRKMGKLMNKVEKFSKKEAKEFIDKMNSSVETNDKVK